MKRGLYLTGFFVLTLLLFQFVIASSTHNANEILININGHPMTLQEAYDNNYLKDTVALPTSDGTTNLAQYHYGNTIQIYLGGRKNLQDVLNGITSSTIGNKGFCKDSSSISWSFIFGHSADEIIFNDGETFQQKINSQKFCSYSWKQGSFGTCNAGTPQWDAASCSVTCGGGTYTRCVATSGTQTRLVGCERSDGKSVGESYCSGAKPTSSQSCIRDYCGVAKACNTQACYTCSDGIQNQGEVGVDCGGPCSSDGYLWKNGAWSDGCYAYDKNHGENRRDVWCERCDGVKVADSYCGGGKPSSTRACSPDSGSSVLCTEAHKQGYLSDDIYNADVEFGKENADEATMVGYHSWAKPLVRVMHENPEISEEMMPLIVEWGKQMAYVNKLTNKESAIGDIFVDVGMPFCKELGTLLMRQGYSEDNEYEFDEEFVEEVFSRYSSEGAFSVENLSEDKFNQTMSEIFSELEAEFFLQKYL